MSSSSPSLFFFFLPFPSWSRSIATNLLVTFICSMASMTRCLFRSILWEISLRFSTSSSRSRRSLSVRSSCRRMACSICSRTNSSTRFIRSTFWRCSSSFSSFITRATMCSRSFASLVFSIWRSLSRALATRSRARSARPRRASASRFCRSASFFSRSFSLCVSCARSSCSFSAARSAASRVRFRNSSFFFSFTPQHKAH
mmetsp:Transcript_139365/g.313404  ORF Transcript_139365/g.313404 Transcript_139365/m.313404 type:complete len:200 (+) Transcript_139365:211-810(+)